MACWICTLGSAYSSTFDENNAIRYFQAFVKPLAICSALRVRHLLRTPSWHRCGPDFHPRSTISGMIPRPMSGRPRGRGPATGALPVGAEIVLNVAHQRGPPSQVLVAASHGDHRHVPGAVGGRCLLVGGDRHRTAGL